MNRAKTLINWASSALMVTLILFAAFMLISSILGWKFNPVMSGSMDPVLKVGGVVAAQQVDPATVETNILYFDVDEAIGSAKNVCDALEQQGIRMLAIAPQRVRAVTHLDVSGEDIERAITALRRVLRSST